MHSNHCYAKLQMERKNAGCYANKSEQEVEKRRKKKEMKKTADGMKSILI